MSLPKLRFKDEAGLVFPDFETHVLGNISDVRDGTHDSPKYHPQGYPLVTSKNLLEMGEIDLENVNLISEADFININKRSKVDSGDILFGMIGTIGNPVIVKTANFAIKNVALIKQKDHLQNIFLVQYLKSRAILKQFNNETVGNTQKFIALGKFRQLDIQIPCINEQTKIAKFLSAIDEKITQLTKKNDLLTQYKKGVMQQIFSQELRFKNDDGQDFPEWEVTTLGEVTELFSRRNKNLIDAEVYSVTNSNGFVLQTEHFEDRVIAGSDLSNYKIIYKDEFAYNPARVNVGSIALFKEKVGVISSLYVCFKCKHSMNNTFLLNYLELDSTKQNINSFGEGGVRIYLWYPLFAKLPITLPSVIEQNKIANFLTAIDDKITAIQIQLKAVKQYKQGLLQQMFV